MNQESKHTATGPLCEVRLCTGGEEETIASVREYPCVIGRRSACDVTIQDPSVSGRHAELTLADGVLCVRDLGSTNGIYRGGERITSLTIEEPLRFRFGDIHIKFVPISESGEGNVPAESPATGRQPTATEKSDGYFYNHGGETYGPYNRKELQEFADQGSLQAQDQVWLPETRKWVSAANVPRLFPDGAQPAADASVKFAAKPAADSAAEDRQIPRHEQIRAKLGGKKGDIRCPHCWHQFAIEDFLYIASHQSLTGDPVLGSDAQQRFRPSRFTPEGNAIDSAGMSCPDMACPRCHLRIPQTASEKPPLFLSIIGATGSGKSFFLTSMVWDMRKTLSRYFAISFRDTDAINNQIINEFEETLFFGSDPDKLVTLRKTELQGELYNQVILDDMLVNLPKPFMFTVNPAEHHPRLHEVRKSMSRTLILYDNAGEHFEPGMDSVDNPTTRHLLHSDAFFFLFDPTRDARFRKKLDKEDPQLSKNSPVQRQEILLTEMINRYKKYLGLREGQKTAITLIMVVSKADVWVDQLCVDLPERPYEWESALRTYAFDINTIKQVSFSIRSLMEETCPEVVSTAESFAERVVYIPHSALGTSPLVEQESGTLCIKPRDINPIWASVPLLYFFYERGLIPARSKTAASDAETVPVEIEQSGDMMFVTPEGWSQPMQIPKFYAGARLKEPRTGIYFDMSV